MKSKSGIWILCVGIVCGIDPTLAGERAMPLYLPSEPLERALLDVGFRLDVSIFADANKLPKGVRSPVLAGMFTPTEALALLLSQTNLRFEYLESSNIFRVFPGENTKDNVTSNRCAGETKR
jgi:hypothetical protein